MVDIDQIIDIICDIFCAVKWLLVLSAMCVAFYLFFGLIGLALVVVFNFCASIGSAS